MSIIIISVVFMILVIIFWVGIDWLFHRISMRYKTEQMKNGRMITNDTISDDTENHAPIETILFLRPFNADNKYMDPVYYEGKEYQTLESFLCVELKKLGVPIAIGKPGEAFKPDGARRIYVGDNWQDVVQFYLKESKLVVLYVDFTPGVQWEIKQALSSYRDKLILVPLFYGVNMNYMSIPSNRIIAQMGILRLVEPSLLRLYNKLDFFPHQRRGRKYYQNWDDTFRDILPEPIDDAICCIYFQDEKPVYVTTKRGDMEIRLTKLVDLIRYKADNIPMREIDLNETGSNSSNSENIFTVYGGFVAFREIIDRLLFRLLKKEIHFNMPGFGQLCFQKDRFTWRIWCLPSAINLFSMNRIKFFNSNQGIKYTDIVSVEESTSKSLRITTRYVSSVFYLQFSSQMRDAMPIVKRVLEDGMTGQTPALTQTEQAILNRTAVSETKRTRIICLILAVASPFILYFFDIFLGLIMIGFAVAYAESGSKLRKAVCTILFVLLCLQSLPILFFSN